MPQIYRVMVRCPQTKYITDTGIRTSGRESLSSNAYGDGAISCLFCRQLHFLDENGFLELDQSKAGDALWRPNP